VEKMLEAAVMCLAMNMYHEARNEGIVGMMAVAEVTLNRVEHKNYPNNVCDVVKQGYVKDRKDCQFSWYCDGKTDKMYDKHWRDNAIELATDYLTGLRTNWTNGATHYHASYVNPYWAKSFKQTVTLGTHKFYK
jgi:N-acetylmuramoyl-L-alanine amidase